ncbi:quinon protein alcohol dehydrogenase-like superfamily [Aspergillus germanicus]
MEGLGAAASIIAVYLTAVKHAKSEVERLSEELDRLNVTLQSAQRLLDGPKGDQLKTANSQALRRETKLRKKLESSSSRMMGKLGIRSLGWPFESKDVDRIIAALERQRDTEQVLDINQTLLLSNLHIVEDSLFDSQANEYEPRCHPDTRIDLLRQIYDWVDDTHGKSVFYLQGMAGTGKSTISRTVAQHLVERADRPLVATFFFKRGEGDRGNASRVVTTLTSQLIAKEPVLAASVKCAIDANHAITSKPMGKQFEQLILTPLKRLKSAQLGTVVLVVDALDECRGGGDIRRLIYQISRGAKLDSAIGAHPETEIRNDLTSFFMARFAIIRDDFNSLCHADSQLPPGCPGLDVTHKLVQMAIPLFIFAATVCRFIEDRAWSNPRAQLDKILQHGAGGSHFQMDNLDATYLLILSQLAVSSKAAQQELLNEFQKVVGTILVLAEPLSANSLSRVLGLAKSSIDGRLMSLHSVLRVPDSPDIPIKMLHLSFRDFMIDPEKCETNPFWIDLRTAHANLADKCLGFLSFQDRLRGNICGLGSPGVSRAEIPAAVINSCLPTEVRYACLYWVYHAQRSHTQLLEERKLYRFLTKHHLHWLEALSLLGRLSECIVMIQGLRDLGARSLVRQEFKSHISGWLTSASGEEATDWTPLLQALEADCDLSETLVFSPDGGKIARSNRSMIYLWDSATGGFRLKIESMGITSFSFSSDTVAFSPDLQRLLVGSPDKLYVFDALTGQEERQRQLICHQKNKNLLALSPKRTTVAWVSPDGAILPEGTMANDVSHELTNCGVSVKILGFSSDGKFLSHTTHRLDGNATAGKHSSTDDVNDIYKEQCYGRTSEHTPIRFSPDGKAVASTTRNRVCLWDRATGNKIREFCHLDRVLETIFSADSRSIISLSKNPILLWDTSSGDERQVELWDMPTGQKLQELTHELEVHGAEFSPNCQILATTSVYKIHVWELTTGKETQRLEDERSITEDMGPLGVSSDSKVLSGFVERPRGSRKIPGPPTYEARF